MTGSAPRSRSGPSGRELARPRTRLDAVAYLVSIAALYAGVVAMFVLDAVGPSCTGATCSTYHPWLRWAIAVATWGFLALVVLAFRFTRAYDRAAGAGHPTARGWPLAWNYLAAGLVVPDAVRALHRPAR